MVYMDNHATTRVDPRVVDAMLPLFDANFGNAHSTSHAAGWQAKDAVDQARELIAAGIGALVREIVFTSGATESNNLAIRGSALVPSERTGLITSAIEHKSVLASCTWLSDRDHKLVICPVRSDGQVDLGVMAERIDHSTRLVSL